MENNEYEYLMIPLYDNITLYVHDNIVIKDDRIRPKLLNEDEASKVINIILEHNCSSILPVSKEWFDNVYKEVTTPKSFQEALLSYKGQFDDVHIDDVHKEVTTPKSFQKFLLRCKEWFDDWFDD